MSCPGLSCEILIFFFNLNLCCLFFKLATAVFGQSVQFLVCLDTTAHWRVRVWGASFPLAEEQKRAVVVFTASGWMWAW